MATPRLADELWAVIEPLLPPVPVSPHGGRPRVSHRAVLTGLLFVLKTGLPWEQLPLELDCGSGRTCWRRLREWQEAGVWAKLHRVFLDGLGAADRIDWSRAAINSTTVPAPKGAKRPGRIRRIAANRARSAMLWSPARASRWPARSGRLMSMM
jgi:transposase